MFTENFAFMPKTATTSQIQHVTTTKSKQTKKQAMNLLFNIQLALEFEAKI